jgi:hypothetical protein
MSERAKEFEGHRIRAFLALGEYLALKQRDFMGQAMGQVMNTVDSAGANNRIRLESPPMH